LKLVLIQTIALIIFQSGLVSFEVDKQKEKKNALPLVVRPVM